MNKRKPSLLSSSQIRQSFLDYFHDKGHQIVSSSSLVPNNDPTLLFTNAGMVQFKDVFLGKDMRAYTRAASSQRCVRAGGKHNDLENVGYTARHHTFFEMLGNFSFGDYFKREAITYAWEFLTKVLQLPAERLWVTVYEDDDEAADIWLKEIGVSPERFSRCGEKDNFWSMGDTGPCGPCTEIFYDHGSDIPGGPPGSAGAELDRYIEIWNLVFMQFNRDKQGVLHPLPKPSVDTGMGLERITAVMQGVHDNYSIDIFKHLIAHIQQLTPQTSLDHPSLKVIADHIRSCAFLVADGIIPSNEGRGYVLRRIIRRALRHSYQLGISTPFFGRLVNPLIEVMGDAYPELLEKRDHIEKTLSQEEQQFSRTLENGLHLLEAHMASLPSETTISGEVAFKLYDTFGFPLDLTQDIAREHELSVDIAGFESCMEKQRKQSQAASQFSIDYSEMMVDEACVFHGYTKENMQAKILALLIDNKKTQVINVGQKAAVILDHTPFYAESGGQVGDTGRIHTLQGVTFQVEDTQKVGETILHFGILEQGNLVVGDTVLAEINHAQRAAVRLNHTATHLLHAALKRIVGGHIQQKGSLVEAERARFDFSHTSALTADEIAAVEICVNQQIRANDAVCTELMSLESAKASGAMALFDEKYSEQVRVLTIGSFSRELCGGTHAARTGDIGLFKITAEYGVSSGVRRIEMVTGDYALQWVHKQLAYLMDANILLKTNTPQLPEKITQILQALKQQEKINQELKQKLAGLSHNNIEEEVQSIHGISLLIRKCDGADGAFLRTTLDNLKSKMDKAVIVLYSIEDNKIQILVGIHANLLSLVPAAGEVVKFLCGKGGGRPDMAQGGGPIPDDFAKRLQQLPTFIADNTSKN